jgi:two-component system response regulator NreC
VTVRLLIVDDHAILRAGLRLLINAQPDLTVAGEAADGDEAIHMAEKTKPDLVLLDLSMPKAGGLHLIPLIRQRCPLTRVLVLSMHQDPACVRAAFDAGATGYVVKKAAHTELLNAVRSVANGKRHVCSICREALVQTALGLDLPEHNAADTRGANLLSKREREVLLMVAQGYTNRQVAERLSLSVKSVESYRARLQDKLGLQTRVELHRYALACGLLRPDGLDEPEPPVSR